MIRIYFLALAVFFGCLQVPAFSTCLNGGDTGLCETREILYETGEAQVLKDKADELGTPATIYEYLRNNAQYTPYHGARSNSLNSFLSLRGNDVDLASTLIAMMRSQGIKARYATGVIRISRDALANWLGGIDPDLAVSILRDQGIQQIDDTDPDTVAFEHVWAEVLVDYSLYRGATSLSRGQCTEQGNSCRWIALDVSFKQKQYKEDYRTLLKDLAFDYDAYYNAQNPDSPHYREGIKNKSPLEIFEEKALAYLHANYPGVTLEDVKDFGTIIQETAGLLPASLPYEVAGDISRYDSIYDHDETEGAVAWTKYLKAQISVPGTSAFDNLMPSCSIPLADLSTKQLTATIFYNNDNQSVLGYRLDRQATGMTLIVGSGAVFYDENGVGHPMSAGYPVDLKLEIDAAPDQDPVSTAYENLMIGGYYLIATGGETSNIMQLKRASEKLLRANEDYPVVVDDDGSIGDAGAVYVDTNGNGEPDSADVPLLNHLEAQDALTGGLLNVAATLYYTRLRQDSERYSRLKGIVSPIAAYLGVVSTTHEVEYLDNVPYSITPGGLLIDLKGIRLNGSWEMNQPETYSSETFKFLGHIGSSLEHEVWQIITGYDAISTMRGIQFALEQGHQLLDIKKNSSDNTFPSCLEGLGFQHQAPGDFQKHEYSLFGRKLVTWEYTGSESEAAFHIFRPDVNGIDNEDDSAMLVTYRAENGFDGFVADYDDLENQLITAQASEGLLKTGFSVSSSGSLYATYDVIQASVSSPAGFTLRNYYRNNSTKYTYIIDETAQHADGSYAVTVGFKVADSTDKQPFSFTGLSAYSVVKVEVLSPSGFAVDSYSKSGDTCSVTIKESGSHSNEAYTLTLKFTLYANSSIYTAQITTPYPIEIIGNRFVDGTYTLTATGLDVSDDMSMSCNGGDTVEELVQYSGSPTELLVNAKACFNNVLTLDGMTSFTNFLDKNKSFNPDTYAYRDRTIGMNEHDIDFVTQIRSDMYWNLQGDAWCQYLLPSGLPMDTTDYYYLFSVYLKNLYSDDTTLAQSTYAIVNHNKLLKGGGGYVTATDTLEQAESEEYNNQIFTDLTLPSVSNNDIVKTPSTADPVSTVTGNMYHDETDFTIKGRGVDFAFTKSYNSGPARSKKDSPFGYGWTHSYNLSLQSNDYGDCPNCGTDQAPENDNGVTSSITYVDERGGEHTYLVDESTQAVTAPPGEFDQLLLNTPETGFHTLEFRNGVQYIFQGSPDMGTTPGGTARLSKIADPYGNELAFTYTNGNLTAITDNLGLEAQGRTGITLGYDDDGHIKTVQDWTGRTWTYTYQDNNLTDVTNPESSISYTYHPDSHLLNETVLPADRNGTRAKVAFEYYRNNKAFSYTNAMDETESLDYDLFRKRTRVTDPRGFVREHQYDPDNGALVKLTEPDGGIMLFENNADGLRYKKTDALGFTTSLFVQRCPHPGQYGIGHLWQRHP